MDMSQEGEGTPGITAVTAGTTPASKAARGGTTTGGGVEMAADYQKPASGTRRANRRGAKND